MSHATESGGLHRKKLQQLPHALGVRVVALADEYVEAVRAGTLKGEYISIQQKATELANDLRKCRIDPGVIYETRRDHLKRAKLSA